MHKYDKEIRKRVEAIDNVPASFKFDAVQTWQKMESQLQPIQQKKKGVWFYWAAAAVLIIAFSCFLLLNKTTEINNGSNLVLSEQITTKEVVLGTNKKSLNHPQPFNKSLAKKPSEKAKDIMPGANTIVIVQSNISQPENAIATIPSTIDSSKAIPIVSAQKPVKKRLKIIHLNELEEKEPLILVQTRQHKKNLLQNDEEQAAPAAGTKSWWPFRNKSNNNSSRTTLQ